MILWGTAYGMSFDLREFQGDGAKVARTFSTFNFIYYLRKEKYKNGRFPQIALASRGGKQRERIGFHYNYTACQICTKFEENNRKVALKY